MWADFPRNKHLKQAIYRGPGGAGDATGDATNASALALAAKDAAQASATSASASATAAANSATAADTSATNASTQATTAAGSATTASTAATNASTYATNAASSATTAASEASDAADSATAAASSATSASTDASTASTAASNASSNASSASTSASTATTKASEAATSATNAASSATTASTAATNASNSASAAATSETNAASSASSASTSASTATTKASEASSSASSASTSASTATTQASNAASSASAASTSASNASTSATNAANSATSAASSATAAAASAVTAATFDPALYLAKSGNLSGLANTATARDNLGVEIGVDVQAFNAALAAIAANNGTNMMKNRIINGAGLINQRGVSGTVTLSAGAYGHDRFKAGASGCTYTFATSGNVTTFTITAGSLIQVVEGLNLETATYCLSWAGTAQGKIGAGSYSASGVTGSITGGTNTNIEFNTGTLSLPQLEKGSTATSFDYRPYGTELALCQRYYEKSYDVGTAPGTNLGSIDSWGAADYLLMTAGNGSTGRGSGRIRFAVTKRAAPTMTYWDNAGNASAVTFFNTNSQYASSNNTADIYRGGSSTATSFGFNYDTGSSSYPKTGILWAATSEL